MTLGKAIQIARIRADIKRPALAEKAGISYSYLSELETDRKDPTIGVLRQIALALNTTVSELLREAGE